MLIEVKNLHKSFGENQVLRGIDVSIQKGEVVVVIGPSGSGKSTFLRCLNLLEQPTDGQVIFDGVDLTDGHVNTLETCRRMGMVFQRFNLFEKKTALENVMEGLIVVKKMKKDEARAIALEELKLVGMEKWANHYPKHMSGGQQQRVAIARAIAQAPPVILADEPTGNLDSGSTKEIMSILKQLHREGRTVILITHDNDIAAQARRVIRIKDGKIEADFEQQVED